MNPYQILENLGLQGRFGSRMSQVQILSPRPIFPTTIQRLSITLSASPAYVCPAMWP